MTDASSRWLALGKLKPLVRWGVATALLVLVLLYLQVHQLVRLLDLIPNLLQIYLLQNQHRLVPDSVYSLLF